MALKGTLRDFGLSDIFQLISHQRKTGILYLEDKGKSVAVTFDEGKVVGAEARSEKTLEKERVGDILLKAGVLDQGRLAQCLQEQERTARKLGVVLTEKKYLTEEIFRQALLFQIKETLFKIFQWTSGTYRFETTKITYDKQFISPMPAEFILMEAARIIDEWPGVRARIPSLEMVFDKVPEAESKVLRRSDMKETPQKEASGPDSDLFGEEKPKAAENDRIVLSPDQERVFDLVNGEHTVSEISYRSLLGEFEASKALQDLVGFGLIRPVKVPLSKPKTQEKDEETRRRKGIFTLVAGLVFTGLLVFVLFAVLAASATRLDFFAQVASEKSRIVREAIADAQSKRLNLAMEAYRLEKGSYPGGLIDLYTSGFVLESDIHYPFNNPYRIHWGENGPSIVPPGNQD